VAFVVVVVGMVFAKFGATAGLPWPLYYGLPAAVTLFLPPHGVSHVAWSIRLVRILSLCFLANDSFFIFVFCRLARVHAVLAHPRILGSPLLN
jgi:hypothetical protein